MKTIKKVATKRKPVSKETEFTQDPSYVWNLMSKTTEDDIKKDIKNCINSSTTKILNKSQNIADYLDDVAVYLNFLDKKTTRYKEGFFMGFVFGLLMSLSIYLLLRTSYII